MKFKLTHYCFSRDLDSATICCKSVPMRFDISSLAKLMVALCLSLSLAFAPLISQQAMAAHHPSSSATEQPLQAEHDMAMTESCDKMADSKSEQNESDCCDMSCSSLVVFQINAGTAFPPNGRKSFDFVSDEFKSRSASGLVRPPRA